MVVGGGGGCEWKNFRRGGCVLLGSDGGDYWVFHVEGGAVFGWELAD